MISEVADRLGKSFLTLIDDVSESLLAKPSFLPQASLGLVCMMIKVKTKQFDEHKAGIRRIQST